jgi:hypothetical protein
LINLGTFLGKIDKRDESYSLIVESVSVGAEGNKKSNLFIKVPTEATAESLKELREYLYQIPGENKVSLIFADSKKTLELPIKINWNEEIAKKISQIINKQQDEY